jgi:RNA polymerase sigma factor (sigma-70 family)
VDVLVTADRLTPTDGELIAEAVSSPVRFALVFDRHYDTVRRYLRARVDAGVAEDLTSDTFVAALASLSRFDTRQDSARPWLLGIATNILRHHRRAEVRSQKATARLPFPVAADDTVDAPARLDSLSAAPHLAAALLKLKADDRDVLLLFGVAELSYDEIAYALSIPVGTVKSRLNRARRQVRTALPPSVAQAFLEDPA